MRTEDLIESLAARGGAVEARPAWRRFALATAAALAGAGALMLALLGVRPDLASAASDAMFWTKLVFAGLLAGAGLIGSLRLSRPGIRLGRIAEALAAPVIAIWVLALVTLFEAQPDTRAALVLGRTWKTCPWNIALLSVPAFIAVTWAMKGYAPTNLRLAGAVAGLTSGALATLVYSLHCPESAPAFIAVWYVLGIAAAALAGAALGPRVLRW